MSCELLPLKLDVREEEGERNEEEERKMGRRKRTSQNMNL
jgi:hypothetical protein